jgi:signal transduction histidine kinase
MTFDTAVHYFMPRGIRDDKDHPEYAQLRLIVSSTLIALPLMLLFPIWVHYMGKPVGGYLLNDFLNLIVLVSVRFWGHYQVPMRISALACYWIMYDWIRDSGGIYSTNIIITHMYLLMCIWVDKKYGWWAIFGNLAFFGFIYYQTLHAALPVPVGAVLGNPLYTFGMNVLITLFFGGFLAYQQHDQERNRVKLRALQEQKISLLDQVVKQRTEQLNTMRESMATDFHDETGNMLSAITRQAALLQSKLHREHEMQPVVDSIIRNSNGLYASSKDFLWHLNHNSDDPNELSDYLTGYGQHYYNQFDIAFSSQAQPGCLMQFEPSVALNIIFIFKEAMTNVVKHAGANEVKLKMWTIPGHIVYWLADNGSWKEADQNIDHYGLSNMEKRCRKNNFGFALHKLSGGTAVEITVPVSNLNQ